ncbi:hypothetical protein [Taibaiella helva]|uniref:hypothetical protein n=1 Tax=Taibaiella helva TaxID=2301235 RepID=UPI000E5925BF|nr:hypothetical protein [Taibaiella helva]
MGPEGLTVLNSIMMRGNGTNKLNGIMLYEQGPEAGEIRFVIQYQNLPKGATVAPECGIPGPQPPIVLTPTIVSTFPAFTTGLVSSIPARYAGTIYFTAVAGQGIFLMHR